MKKNSLLPVLLLNLAGFIIGALGQALKFVPSIPQDALPFLQYSIWVLSTGLFIVPWIWRATSILKRLSETAGIAEELPGKLNELTIWRRNEHLEKIRVTVSDFDDYLILLPLHLSMSFLKGMDVEFETHCCGSDKKALEELASGNCKFAITDPYYLKDYPNSDFVLLAPMITKSPMWWLTPKRAVSLASGPVRIFSYEKNEAKNNAHTYTGRMLEAQISKYKWRKGDYEVHTVNTVIDELCDKLVGVVKDDDGSLIDSFGGLDAIRKAKSISAFECLLFSCLESNDVGNKIKKITEDYFRGFDYYLLTEPDSSFVLKLFSCDKELVTLDNNYIFTGIITTRQYLNSYPVESLKMLRGLRDGLLKSNIALMNKNAKIIKKAFQDALSSQHSGLNKGRKLQLFNNAFGFIDTFLLDESFFPDDLILLDTGMRFTPDESPYNKYIEKYRDNILRTSVIGGKKSDLEDESIQFIIRGLGYDC